MKTLTFFCALCSEMQSHGEKRNDSVEIICQQLWDMTQKKANEKPDRKQTVRVDIDIDSFSFAWYYTDLYEYQIEEDMTVCWTSKRLVSLQATNI